MAEKSPVNHWPLAFIAFAMLGAICLLVGFAALAGLLRGLHPVFNDEMAGMAMIVSAIACFLSGAFPLVLRRLADRERACLPALPPAPDSQKD